MSIGDIIGSIWEYGLLRPMLNSLVFLSHLLMGNFGLAIVLFTIGIRAATFPLTLRQLKSSRALTSLQPKMQELQKKYKDPRRRSEETMKLYKEAGGNPLGCVFPMLIQFPIWIALYQTVLAALGSTPESLFGLSSRLYPWSYIYQSLPLENHFLWMNLGRPDPFLPFLVGVSTYVQQRMITAPAADPRQASTNQMMLWMMPIMFAWFTLTVPSGLAVYWTVTNIVGILMNASIYGWRSLHWRQLVLGPVPAGAPARGPAPEGAEPAAKREEGGEREHARGDRGKRKDGRRRRRQSTKTARPR